MGRRKKKSVKVVQAANNSSDPGDSQTESGTKISAANRSNHDPIRLKIKLKEKKQLANRS